MPLSACTYSSTDYGPDFVKFTANGGGTAGFWIGIGHKLPDGQKSVQLRER
jgi:hypothetical protein